MREGGAGWGGRRGRGWGRCWREVGTAADRFLAEEQIQIWSQGLGGRTTVMR